MAHADVDDVVALDVIVLDTRGDRRRRPRVRALRACRRRTDLRGQVLASSRRAVYIETGGTVLVFVSAGAPPGPIHLRAETLESCAGEARSGWTGSFPSVHGGARRRSTPTFLRAARHGAGNLTETAAPGLAGHPAVDVAEWAVGRG